MKSKKTRKDHLIDLALLERPTSVMFPNISTRVTRIIRFATDFVSVMNPESTYFDVKADNIKQSNHFTPSLSLKERVGLYLLGEQLLQQVELNFFDGYFLTDCKVTQIDDFLIIDFIENTIPPKGGFYHEYYCKTNHPK